MKNHTFKRLFGYLKAHRLRLFFILLFASVSTIFTVMAPFVIGKVTTTLFDSIRDGVFYWETIWGLLAVLVCLYLVSQFFSFLQGFHMAKIAASAMREVRCDIDNKMHRLKLDYYDTHTHGDILSVITNDVDTINNTVSQNLTSMVTQVITAIGCLRAIGGFITVGNVQAMLEYTRRFAEPFSSLAGMAGSFGAAKAAGDRIFALLGAEEELPDTEHGIIPQDRLGSVTFQNVQFGYTPERMLMRFYEINSGIITVDGVNICDMQRKIWTEAKSLLQPSPPAPIILSKRFPANMIWCFQKGRKMFHRASVSF